MKIYNKLVRDKIPEIIEADGRKCKTTVVENMENYKQMMISKLKEEVEEYVQSGEVEELADILEVIFALSQNVHEVDVNKLESIRIEKRKERGGFDLKIILNNVYD